MRCRRESNLSWRVSNHIRMRRHTVSHLFSGLVTSPFLLVKLFKRIDKESYVPLPHDVMALCSRVLVQTKQNNKQTNLCVFYVSRCMFTEAAATFTALLFISLFFSPQAGGQRTFLITSGVCRPYSTLQRHYDGQVRADLHPSTS